MILNDTFTFPPLPSPPFPSLPLFFFYHLQSRLSKFYLILDLSVLFLFLFCCCCCLIGAVFPLGRKQKIYLIFLAITNTLQAAAEVLGMHMHKIVNLFIKNKFLKLKMLLYFFPLGHWWKTCRWYFSSFGVWRSSTI